MTNKLPKFKGEPLIEIPQFIPVINFLEGDFGKAVDAEVQGKYGKHRAISVVRYDPEMHVVVGSTPFYCVAVNEFIASEGLRTVNPADLLRMQRARILPIGQHEDTALVLGTEGDPNRYLARHLMMQIRARRQDREVPAPAVIPLSEIGLCVDQHSPQGLRFKLKDCAQVFYDLSVLNKDGRFSLKDVDDETGLPNQTRDKGDYYLSAGDSGLSVLRVSNYHGIYSDCVHLEESSSSGRITVISTDNNSRNFKIGRAALERRLLKGY